MEHLMEEKMSLMQRVKGLQSGKKRRSVAAAVATPLTAETEKTITSSHNQTTIAGIDNDIVLVHEKLNSSTFSGRRYFGQGSKFKRTTDGHIRTYAEIPDSKDPCSSISKKDLQRRVHFIEDVVETVSKGERTILYSELLRLNKDVFKQAFKDAGISTMDTLSTKDAVAIQSLLRLPTNKMRKMRICLNNLRMNILPSERKMRREKSPITSHLNVDSVETGFIGLRRVKCEGTTTACPYLRIKNIVPFLEEIIAKDTHGFRHDGEFNNCWWFLFSGDKGGLHMKYYVEIVNSLNSGSVDNVHIYAMFEAQDSVENMMKVWYPTYHDQIKAMQNEEFCMSDGRQVQIFLGGDYHFLDDNMGHQGSSATFPSAIDKVLLSHLQNHGGTPHTPENCKVEKRTIEDYLENYNENLADTRANYNLHDNGKYHSSVVGPMMFPIKDLLQVVPPTLHIMLGVVLLIYNLLLTECKKIDDEDGNQARLAEEKEAVSQEWEISSLQLDMTETLLREQGEAVVVMINRRNRLDAVIRGDVIENKKLASVSDVSRKTSKGKKTHETCNSTFCIITNHDRNVEWVQCDACDAWYHIMCVGLTPEDEVTLADISFKCIICEGGEDLQYKSIADEKIATLLQEEDEIMKRKISEKIKCDNLNATYTNLAGNREKELTAALERIKVVRQAYHGNVMVGNHSIIVLKKYHVLTDVIQDRPAVYCYFNELFNIFSNIMKLLMTRLFLSNTEIGHLVEQFGAKFPVFFPARNITRKIHELVFNVVPFVSKHKTIGLLSEQESESKHAAINAELRALACVRNHAERLKLVVEREELRSYMNKGLLKTPSMLCPRVFMRAGNDGERHCRNCEKDFFSG